VFQTDELPKVLTSLRRRFLSRASAQHFGLVGLTIGVARKGGQPDMGRSYAVRFEVANKLKRVRSPKRPLPASVKVRVKHGNGFKTVTLPTDVVVAEEIIPSGRMLDTPTVAGSDRAATGVVVNWKARVGLTPVDWWGVLTVGHACSDPASLGGSAVGWWNAQTGQNFFTPLVARTEHSGLDVAIFLVADNDLTQDGIALNMQAKLPAGAMFANHTRQGRSLNPKLPGVMVSLQAITPPQNRVLGILGEKDNIVEVSSANPLAFAPESSGSVWLLNDDAGTPLAACMQLATNKNDHSVGYGQVLDGTILDWVEEMIDAISSPYPVVGNSFRFVCSF
jgi:hypothetical protein